MRVGRGPDRTRTLILSLLCCVRVLSGLSSTLTARTNVVFVRAPSTRGGSPCGGTQGVEGGRRLQKEENRDSRRRLHHPLGPSLDKDPATISSFPAVVAAGLFSQPMNDFYGWGRVSLSVTCVPAPPKKSRSWAVEQERKRCKLCFLGRRPSLHLTVGSPGGR